MLTVVSYRRYRRSVCLRRKPLKLQGSWHRTLIPSMENQISWARQSLSEQWQEGPLQRSLQKSFSYPELLCCWTPLYPPSYVPALSCTWSTVTDYLKLHTQSLPPQLRTKLFPYSVSSGTLSMDYLQASYLCKMLNDTVFISAREFSHFDSSASQGGAGEWGSSCAVLSCQLRSNHSNTLSGMSASHLSTLLELCSRPFCGSIRSSARRWDYSSSGIVTRLGSTGWCVAAYSKPKSWQGVKTHVKGQ